MTRERTRRWRGVIAIALAAAGLAILADRPDLLLVAVAGVVFAVFPNVTRLPSVSLDLDRRLSHPLPAEGDTVEVTTTITNTGDRVLPDLRIVDGVPPALGVVDGSPRRGMALRPGQSAELTYTVEAKQGIHAFEPATVLARDLSGERERVISLTDETAIDCDPEPDPIALRNRLRPILGEVVSNRGGSGTDFHHTRDYHPGDPVNRIDWNRLARTGDLVTVDFDAERAASVVLVVDARASAYRGQPGQSHAVVHCVAAARQLLRGLHNRRNLVGLAGVGRSACWVPPGAGTEHVERMERALARHETFSATPPPRGTGEPSQLTDLEHRLADDDQVIVLSPVCDDAIVEACLRLEAGEHAVTVVSPDVTGGDSLGERVATLERSNRLQTLFRAGVPVYGWAAPEREPRLLGGVSG